MQTTGPATGKDTRQWRERLERLAWRSLKPLRQRLASRREQRFVFAAGMQRSGTNMLMETLEWSAATDVYHETDPRTFDNYEMRAPSIIRAVASRSPAPLFVIKSLCELDRVGALMDEFSPAQTLWLVRRYDDAVNSAIRSFGNFVSQNLRLARDKTAADWRGQGMSDQTQAVIRRLARPDMSEASGAALMWYYRNVLFFEQGFHVDPRVKLLFYEDLVADNARVLEEVFSFMGAPDWSPSVSRYIHVKSVGKSPSADIDPGIREVCDGLSARFDALGH